MPSSTRIPAARNGRPHQSSVATPETESRFDRRLNELLAHATEVFCEKGYEGASMRDLSRASGMSLAGLYHYFGSKERLLYLIQKHTFTTIVEELKLRLEGIAVPEQRVRIFIQNHLEYFMANQSGLKVLAHEDEALKNGFNSEIAAIKREYYGICLALMEDLKRAHKLEFNSRTAVMSLFGMINWIYTWYNPRIDGAAAELAEQMSAIILSGVGCVSSSRAARRPKQVSSQAGPRRAHTLKPLSSRTVRRQSRERARDLHSAGANSHPAKRIL